MKRIILNAFLIGLLFVSSQSFAQEKTKDMPSSSLEEKQTQKAEHKKADGIDGMSLNNDEKWEMDDHTRQSFAQMVELFLNTDIASLNNDELKSYGIALQKNLDDLIRGCTMEGEPHDQLHIFLMGYMPEVEELSNSGSQENAQNIQYYLENYSKYFK
tara:strand:+ start:23325 stop:23798 length:474 start_codon:yes stop_codon:yes gene_type:complete